MLVKLDTLNLSVAYSCLSYSRKVTGFGPIVRSTDYVGKVECLGEYASENAKLGSFLGCFE